MAERTAVTDSEKIEEIVADKMQEVVILSTETPVVTEDGSEIKKRIKRHIITVQERFEIERDGRRYRRDRNGRWRLVLYWLTFHTIRQYGRCHPKVHTNVRMKYHNNSDVEMVKLIRPLCTIRGSSYSALIRLFIYNVHSVLLLLIVW